MRKFTYVFFVLLLLAGVDLYFLDSSEDIIGKKKAVETEVYETFEKKEGEISKRKSAPVEIQRLEKATSREIASPQLAKLAKRGDRIIIGQKEKHFQDENRPLEMLNVYNIKWKDMLSKELLDFLPDGTKAIIKRDGGFVKITNNRGVLLEKALVSVKLPNGTQSSYHALVDSSNGRIVHTWNSSRIEGMVFPLKLTPSGVIKSTSRPN